MGQMAFKDSWKHSPIDKPKRIEFACRFVGRQFFKVVNGLIPQSMEDKWFIFYDDGWVYFHRARTGYGIYKAELIYQFEGYIIKEFWVERNKEKYQNEDDNIDIENFKFLIARGLLGIDVRKDYAERNFHSDEDVLRAWSEFGNLLISNKGLKFLDEIRSVLFGIAVGDALGVPAEFKTRESLLKTPIREMTGYGTHNMPAGTWSDDSSLSFCLAEALTHDFDLKRVSDNFQKWLFENYWTATGEVFDVGITTRNAIHNLSRGTKPEFAGAVEESSNGNGSLMRILPLVFYIKDKPIDERFQITKAVSSITHAHIRSVIACFYYLEFARQLLNEVPAYGVFKNLMSAIPNYLQSINISAEEIKGFDRLFTPEFQYLREDQIYSSGYVVHTLEASIWCLLQQHSYKDVVLKAVNLGGDTDTTAAVTGGLAGLRHGIFAIPDEWLDQVSRKDDIEDLANRLFDYFTRN